MQDRSKRTGTSVCLYLFLFVFVPYCICVSFLAEGFFIRYCLYFLYSSISGDVKRLVSDVKSVVICLTGEMDCCTHLFILHNIGWDGVSEV